MDHFKDPILSSVWSVRELRVRELCVRVGRLWVSCVFERVVCVWVGCV